MRASTLLFMLVEVLKTSFKTGQAMFLEKSYEFYKVYAKVGLKVSSLIKFIVLLHHR